MQQDNIKLVPLDRNNPDHLDLMFSVRTHPEVSKYLCNSPPESFDKHVQYLEQAEKNGLKKFFLISSHEGLCGYCHVSSRDNTLDLGWALHPDYWGVGIGKSSVKLLVQCLHESGCAEGKHLSLIVKKDNLRALSLYKKCGFIIISENEKQEYVMEYQAMNRTPEISVILSTCCRNYGDERCPNLFMRAIDSILSQTFQDFELVLIDDGSTDGTAEIAKKYAKNDARVRYFRFDPNSNAPAKRYNQGISLSKGKWIAFMFDDDELLPNALEDLYQSIAHLPPIYGMVNGTIEYNHIINNVNQIIHPNFGLEASSFRELFLSNKLANNSVLIRREVFDLVGGYDETHCMRRICDWDLWIRINMRYKVKVIPKKVAKLYGGLPDSLLYNFELNYSKIYARQLHFFRKQPLRKYYYRMSPAQWIHFLFRVALMPFYLYLRYADLWKGRDIRWIARKIQAYVRKSSVKVLKPILRKLGFKY